MIFQWYLFVLLLVVWFLAPRMGQTYSITVLGHREIHYGWVPVLAITIPLIYLAGTRADIGDTGAYRRMFRQLSGSLSEIASVLDVEGKDRGFTVFSILIKSVIGNRDKVFFTIIAAIVLLCVARTYKHYSINFIMSMFLFIASSDYVQWTYNGMRQFIAVAVIFACTGLILKKKYIWMILVILLMSTIHMTALLMIPMIFVVQGKPFNFRTMGFMAAILLAIFLLEDFTDLLTGFMENTQYSGEVDQYLSTEGTNMLRVLVFAIPPLLALIFRKRVLASNDKRVYLAVNMSVASFGCYLLSAFTSGIFIGRIPIYFSLYNYILLPWLIERVFNKSSARLVYVCMIGLYLVFYYYQMAIVWELKQ